MSSVNGSKFNTPQFNTNDELGCGSLVPGAPTVKEQARSTIFCKDVTINGSLTVKTSCEIIPAAIGVGGQTFVPTVIQTISGPHLVLAVY